MFKRRTSSPSVRIPASVLKKEAQKEAKRIMATERKKEITRERRERIKAQAAKKIERKKDVDSYWDSFMTADIKREIWGGTFIGAGIVLLALFFGGTAFTVQVVDALRFLFGVGTWFLPPLLLVCGVTLLIKKDLQLHPLRIFFIVLFFFCLLGVWNLLTPVEDALTLAPNYGGAVGFTVEFFPRQFLGTGVTAVLLLVLTWILGVIGFGFKLSSFLSPEQEEKKTPRKIPPGSKTSSVTEESPSEEDPSARHFENDLEIIDSTGGKKNGENSIQLQDSQAEELTKSKNRDIKGNWEPPSLDILNDDESTITVDEADLREKAELIREKLEQFGINVTMKSVHVGPTVTQFTLEPSAGVKLNRITALKNDLALTLAAETVRIEAPIRGMSLVGIEIPNANRAIVGMKEILESEVWTKQKEGLQLAIGRDVAGRPVIMDLSKMPHLLIAGKTGSGKSVAMNAFLCSLLWRHSPENLRLILVDPKRVELGLYNNIPHLLTPVIVEPQKSVSALAWAVAEMNRRYRAFSEAKCRNITEYNERHPDNKEPFIVIVIDELADLMMVAGKDVEAAICRIAQLARAVGMHLIVATQRPSVDVVTGLIKANLPARIAFKVSSGIDSRTIMDGIGAEDLLGFGDMLCLDGNNGKITRIQGIYISNEEVERITNHIKLQFPEMVANDEITSQSIEGMAKGGVLTAGQDEVADEDLDDRYEEAVNLVLETGKASASLLQRRLEVGYARAARLLDQMESRGIIGPAKGAKAREIYGHKESHEDSSL